MSKSEQVQLKGNKRIVVCDAHAKIKIFNIIKSFDNTMLCMCPFGGTVDSNIHSALLDCLHENPLSIVNFRGVTSIHYGPCHDYELTPFKELGGPHDQYPDNYRVYVLEYLDLGKKKYLRIDINIDIITDFVRKQDHKLQDLQIPCEAVIYTKPVYEINGLVAEKVVFLLTEFSEDIFPNIALEIVFEIDTGKWFDYKKDNFVLTDGNFDTELDSYFVDSSRYYHRLYIGDNPDILWYACRHSEEYNRLQYCKSIHDSGYQTAAAIDEFLIKCQTNRVLNLGYREVAYDYLARANSGEIILEIDSSITISFLPMDLKESFEDGIIKAIKSLVDHCKGQSISYVFEHRFDFVDREEGEQEGESIVAKTIQQLGGILPSFLKSDSDGPVKCSHPEELAARASHDYKAFETSLFANDASSIPLVGSPDLNSRYDDCST